MKIKDALIRTIKEKIVQHRREAHHTDDLEVFIDCSGCGALEAYLRRLEKIPDDQIQ